MMITTQVQLATLIKFCVSYPQLGCDLLRTLEKWEATIQSENQIIIDAKSILMVLQPICEQDVIKIDSIGNIRRDSDNVVRIYLMQDRNKDITQNR